MIDYKTIKDFCTRNIKSFKDFGEVSQTKDGILISNIKASHNVLAVAHLDYVADNKAFTIYDCTFDGKKDVAIYNGSLDDRLGAYVICNLLPSMGLNYDILLTEGEELGRSTAAYFESIKAYNWMFSFDRRGDDVVMYQYDNKESRKLLKDFGLKPGIGSFSDISWLDHLGCTGFNFGTGYYNEHSKNHFASMNVLKGQVTKFVNFFHANKDVKMPFTEIKDDYKGYGRYYLPSKLDQEWRDYDKGYLYSDFYCDLCGDDVSQEKLTEYRGFRICESCISEICQCTVCQNICFDNETVDGICIDCIDEMSYTD